MIRVIWHITIILTFLFLGGCAADEADLESQIKTIKKQSKSAHGADWVMLMDSIITLNPNDPEPYYRKAVREFRSGDLVDGIQNLETAARLDPTQYINYLGFVYLLYLRDYDKAQEIFELAIKKGLKQDIIIAGSAYMRLGIVYYKKGKYKEAVNALDLDIKEVGEKNVYNYTFVYRGMAKAKLKDYDGAIADFDKAVALWDKCPEAYYQKALLLQQLGKKSEACKMVQKALLNKGFIWANPHRAYIDQLYDLDLERLFDKTCR